MKNGEIYWIKMTNMCPCPYCTNLTDADKWSIELARYSSSTGWELFGTDEGIDKYVEIAVLSRVTNPYVEPEDE